MSGGQLAPIGLADAVPTYATATYYPNVGIELAQQFASYAAIYKSQVWVATLVNKIAYSQARLPLKVYERGSGGRAEARDTPFARLLRNPNSRHDPFFFWLWTRSTFEIYGEALWVKMRPAPGEPPTQLWPLHPSNVATKRDDKTGELIYVYYAGTAAAAILEIRQSDVVHFKSYNPDGQIRGLSRLEPLRQTILSEDAARRGAAALWKNGARPSVVLSTDRTMTQPAIDRVTESWRSMHGGVDNWGKTAILEEGLTPHVMQLNAEEMQYIESRRLSREEACGIYDVPPPAVHILDRATFSNITEQNRMVYRDTMAPRLGMDESVIDTQLRPDFDPQGNLYAEFLLDEVLRGDFEARVAAYETMSRIGGMMPAEIRERENLPDAGPETHRLYVNAATIPLGEVTHRAQMVQEGAELVPIAADSQVPAVPTKTVCGLCEKESGTLSKRGWCRSCEGKASRRPKEIAS